MRRLALARTVLLLPLLSLGCDVGTPSAPGATPVALSAPAPIHLSVTGMHCEGCEGAICAKVGKIEGVSDCTASHVDERVDLVAPPEQRESIVRAIERLGYTVEGDAPAPAPADATNGATNGAANGATSATSTGESGA
ncbi:MAG: Heavy-metal-associated domain [Planctomycetota bacterium]